MCAKPGYATVSTCIVLNAKVMIGRCGNSAKASPKATQVDAARTEARQQVVCKARPCYCEHLHFAQHKTDDRQMWQFWRQSLTQWQRKGVWAGCHQHYADPASKEKPPDSSSPAHIALQYTLPAAFTLRVLPLGRHMPMQHSMQRLTSFKGGPQTKCRRMMTTHQQMVKDIHICP